MNDRIMAITSRYKWVTIPLMVVKMIVEAALLAGAIMSLGLKPRGRSWFFGALAAAIVVELILAVPAIIIQRETQVVMSEMMPKVVAAQPGAGKAPPAMNDVISTFFSAIGIFSIIVALAWLAAKVVFYALGIRYLCQPAVRALFAPSPGDTSAEPA